MIPENPGKCRFSRNRLSRLRQIERWHFWFIGRRRLINQLLRRYLNTQAEPVLDLGCGTGWMLETLTAQGHRAIGLDLRPEGLFATRQALPESWLLQAEGAHLPFKEDVLGAAILLDVLEHVDDRLALSEVQRALRKGGLAVITVPAMAWLWSHRDEAAGHLRRYTRRRLLRLLTHARFQVQEVRYYQCMLLPLLLITRLLGRRGPRLRDLEERPPPILNTILSWINRIEVKLGAVIPWPCGSSLVVVCRKR